ncbi:unnamed protein product, partial [Ectocarpus sp. 12 AP-2014]
RAHWLLAICLILSAALPATAEENDTAAAEQASAGSAGQSGEAETDDEKEKEKPEEARPAVQPELEAATEGPPEIKLPDAETADIRQQIRSLRTSLDQRQVAVDSTRNRLTYAESLLNRLQDEYDSFELRLEKAGLNLTGDYAGLLQQRLERLRRQEIAEDLIRGIENQLTTAREEQLRLEEFEAIIDPGDDARDQLRSLRANLIRQLHKAVTEHIDVLNEYYSTVSALQGRVEAYQTLLQQRLFWLPSAPTVGMDTLTELFRSA